MKTILAALIAISAAAPAYASCYGSSTRYCNDLNTGNSYTTRRTYDGGSTTQGYNAQTGSMWSSRTSGTTGRTTGTDSNGNLWTCDRYGNCN